MTVVDGEGQPVAGATVNGHWEIATVGTDTGFTDAQGKFACTSDPMGSPGTGTEFVFVVDQISKPGWFYDESSSETTAVAVVQ